MKAVFDAILTKYNASTTLKNAVKGGLHRHVVPDNARYPFIVMQMMQATPSETFGETEEDVTVQFTIVSNTSNDDEIDDIFTKLTAAFDWCTLTVSGYTFVYCKRTVYQSAYNVEDDVWNYAVQYQIGIEKTT